MPIDFRNPLASQGGLLARLRNMVSRTESPAETSTPGDGVADQQLTDRVSLSSNAQRIADELRTRDSAVQHDAERIEALKQAVNTGTFRIDSARIADKVSLHYGSR